MVRYVYEVCFCGFGELLVWYCARTLLVMAGDLGIADGVCVWARGVVKRYGRSELVLRGVDLEVREGEFLAVVGASGSGKSTLLHLLGGVDTVTAGEIVVCGYDLGGGLGDRVLSRYRSEVIGFVFQFFYLQPYLSVAKNLEVPLMLTGMSGGDRLKLVGEVAGLVGMDGKLKSYPGALSGGEMQRVAIARAVIGGPRVILADEPTGNLDRVNGGKIAELLDQIRREKKTTLIVVTHDEEIAGMADRVVRMKDGVLIDD